MMTALLFFTVLLSCIYQTQSYVIDGGPSSSASSSILSRFHNINCKLFVTIDKTAPPPTNNDDDSNNSNNLSSSIATGSKLGLPLEIQFTSSTCTNYEMNNEPLLHGTNQLNPGPTIPPLLSLQPLAEPKFVSLEGQQSVKVSEGCYACQLTDGFSQQCFFRFFLDFPEGATRNDVTLPAERVYFMTACWLTDYQNKSGAAESGSGGENIIAKARQWKTEYESSLSSLNTKIHQLENDDTVGLVARTRRFPQYIDLLKQRKNLINQIDMLNERFPLDRPMVEGPNGTLFLKEGVVAVKREVSGEGGGGEGKGVGTRYCWIGTFSFKDFWDAGDSNDDEMKDEKEEKEEA